MRKSCITIDIYKAVTHKKFQTDMSDCRNTARSHPLEAKGVQGTTQDHPRTAEKKQTTASTSSAGSSSQGNNNKNDNRKPIEGSKKKDHMQQKRHSPSTDQPSLLGPVLPKQSRSIDDTQAKKQRRREEGPKEDGERVIQESEENEEEEELVKIPSRSNLETPAMRGAEVHHWDLENALHCILNARSRGEDATNNHSRNQSARDYLWPKSSSSSEDDPPPWITFRLGHAGDVSELARLYRQRVQSPTQPPNGRQHPPEAPPRTARRQPQQPHQRQPPVRRASSSSSSPSHSTGMPPSDETTSLEVRLAEAMGDEDHPPVVYCLLAFVHQEKEEETENLAGEDGTFQSLDTGDSSIETSTRDKHDQTQIVTQDQRNNHHGTMEKSHGRDPTLLTTDRRVKATTTTTTTRLAAAAMLTEQTNLFDSYVVQHPPGNRRTVHDPTLIRVEWIVVNDDGNHSSEEDSTRWQQERQSVLAKLWLCISSLGLLLKSAVHVVDDVPPTTNHNHPHETSSQKAPRR